jgi:hypothetical protein
MFKQQLGLLVLGIGTAMFAQPSLAAPATVSCQTDDIPAVVAVASESGRSQKVNLLSFLPQYFSPESAVQNCQTAAATLQALYNRGQVNYLASDTIDGKSTVCAVERRGMSCDSQKAQLLFTLAPNVDPSQALYDMLGSQFKGTQRPDSRTVSRIYTDIKPRRWFFF